MPKVTVLLPTYNSSEFIQSTIESIMNQTFQDFELLIMDDGSTDNTSDIVKLYTDPRIRYVLCSHDYIATLNKGLELATGKYIARIDADDLMVPERLQVQYDFMEQHGDIIACGAFMESFGKNRNIMPAETEYHSIVITMILGNTLYNPTGFFRMEDIKKNKIRYNKNFAHAEDYKFWTDLAKIGKLANISEILVKYRIHDNQVSFVNQSRMAATSRVVQYEMVEYFLSLIDDENEISGIIKNDFIPSFDQLNNYALFSAELYFKLMHELISALYYKEIISLR